MPAADADLRDDPPPPSTSQEPITQLPFSPITKDHIINCAVHSWHPRYRAITPLTRLIPLPQSFIDFLRADGIFLPPEPNRDDAEETEDDGWDEEPQEDPSAHWSETHEAIISTIKELGGRVHPKFNWSAPKDATFMSPTNTMECMTANDIYLLLKSSDFVTHDLEHAFYDCAPGPERNVPYHLALRKSIPALISSMEFRCFVRQRRIIGISQRELIQYDFMPSLQPIIQDLIEDFFEEKLRDTFPDDDFVFDVYVPHPKASGRVWLMDINPWSSRTDPLLFSWLELLTMEVPDRPRTHADSTEGLETGVVSLMIRPNHDATSDGPPELRVRDESVLDIDPADEELRYQPEFRIVNKGDPEAYSFNSPLYSAHKLPREVVEASIDGGVGMRDFMARWRQHERDAADGTIEDSEDE